MRFIKRLLGRGEPAKPAASADLTPEEQRQVKVEEKEDEGGDRGVE